MIQFDHIEVHVKNAKIYTDFLLILFDGGRAKKISDKNTFMFLSPDNLRIEVKENLNFVNNFNINNDIGFCLPCLRMNGAKNHLDKLSNITILKQIENPDGLCIFFQDYEGIDWHIKDYEILDLFTNI
jgi:hypothetical protein